MCNDEEMTDKLVVLTPEDIFDLGRAVNVATVAGTSRLSPERSAQLQQALAAAVPAGPRYLLVARDSNWDGRDDLEIETYATREELVAAVTGYALSYYDDLAKPRQFIDRVRVPACACGPRLERVRLLGRAALLITRLEHRLEPPDGSTS